MPGKSSRRPSRVPVLRRRDGTMSVFFDGGVLGTRFPPPGGSPPPPAGAEKAEEDIDALMITVVVSMCCALERAKSC